MDNKEKAIGGYNSIDIRKCKVKFEIPMYAFQSARAALYAYLMKIDIDVIYLPNYICNSLDVIFDTLDIEVKFYNLNNSLMPDDNVDFEEGSAVVIVNYFGLLDGPVALWAEEMKFKNKIIVDNSQALFCKPIEDVATIYSPRKYLAIPDGGWLIVDCEILAPEKQWDSSDNVKHLLLRGYDLTEEGYKYFIESEKALENPNPHKMSELTKKMISYSDFDGIARQRVKNYLHYHDCFCEINKSGLSLQGAVPLCYPLRLDFDVNELHTKLCENRIYSPRYWNEKTYTGECTNWYSKTLYLPVDDSLNVNDLDDVIAIIHEYINND